ncbi:MAG: hypothetical protein AABZ35_00355, partial [Gemmatimonadota bacterium]
ECHPSSRFTLLPIYPVCTQAAGNHPEELAEDLSADGGVTARGKRIQNGDRRVAPFGLAAIVRIDQDVRVEEERRAQ